MHTEGVSDFFLHKKYTCRKETGKLAAAENGVAHANWFSISVCYLVFFTSLFWYFFGERNVFYLQHAEGITRLRFLSSYLK